MTHATRIARARTLKKTACVVLCVLLALMLPISLAGCKYSDVLTEHIEDPDKGEEDPHIEPLYENSPDADPEDIISAYLDDTEREDEQELTLPDYAENQDNQEETDNRESREDSSHEQEATEGDEETEDDGDNTEVGSGDTTIDSTSGSGSGKGTGNSAKRNQSGQGPVGDVQPNGGNGGDVTIFDSSGKSQPLPEIYGSVAAAGPYATIVQMLCGKGGLVACDQQWKDMCLSKGVFPSEGISDLKIVFQGTLEEGYTIDFGALKSSGAKAVITNGATVTEGEKENFRAAGINVLTFPSLNMAGTSDEDVCDAVAYVGDLMKSSRNASLNSQSMAGAWRDVHDQVIDACKDANGGYSYKMVAGASSRRIYQDTGNNGQSGDMSSTRITTAFIDSWTTAVSGSTIANRHFSDATMSYLNGSTVDSSSGIGLSAVVGSSQFALLDYYLQVSGVVNNAYPDAAPRNAVSGREAQYLVGPGDLSALDRSSQFASRPVPSALWYTQNSPSRDATWITAGDASFPAVLVRTTEIADQVVGSANRSNGIYNVGQPYGVWVVPSGLCGSWSVANPESFMVSLWALCMFQSGQDLSGCSSVVNDYYKAFYRAAGGAGTGIVDNYHTAYTAECPRG